MPIVYQLAPGALIYESLIVTFTSLPDPYAVHFDPPSITLTNTPYLPSYNFTVLALKQGTIVIQPVLGGYDGVLFYTPAGMPVIVAKGLINI